MLYRIFFFLLFVAFIEFYSYQAVKTLVPMRAFRIGYLVASAVAIVYFVYAFSRFDRHVGQTKQTLFTMGLLLLIVVPKLIMVVTLFGEDFFRVIEGCIKYFYSGKAGETFLPARRKFVSQIGLGLAAIPFLSLIYGMTIGKYNFKVRKQTIYYPDLPDAFDGFKITQISDVHSGSLDNAEKINFAIDLVNEQRSDLIVFTGDIVNTHAKEMHPWIDSFKRIIPHKYGKFAVLGNHDYGEYVTWDKPAQKEANFRAIKNLYGEIGFDLMLNEHRIVTKGSDKVAIVGVENWGKNFKQAGDLNKATGTLTKDDFKILLSHDPSHWEYEVKRDDRNFQLTFCGHTHGMQFGIEIPGYIKWSLAQYVYKQWAGLYSEFGRYVYVNRGFGFHAYPGRVGIMPEITVIKLKKGEKLV